MEKEITIRLATREDAALIESFIRKLATYEDALYRTTVTPELVEEWMFEKQKAEVAFAMIDGKEAGFMLFYECFVAFRGKPGMYIGELYIDEEYRNMGCGDKLFKFLAKLGLERGYCRMEWCCFDWNERAKGFYKRRGAFKLEECGVYRLEEDGMREIVKKS